MLSRVRPSLPITSHDTTIRLQPNNCRPYLFWFACIPIRTTIALTIIWIGLYAKRWLYLAGIYLILTGVGFIYNIILTCMKRKEYGGLGGKVWWVRMRYLHGVFWIAAAVSAFLHQVWTGYILVLDVMVAGIAGSIHYLLNASL